MAEGHGSRRSWAAQSKNDSMNRKKCQKMKENELAQPHVRAPCQFIQNLQKMAEYFWHILHYYTSPTLVVIPQPFSIPTGQKIRKKPPIFFSLSLPQSPAMKTGWKRGWKKKNRL